VEIRPKPLAFEGASQALALPRHSARHPRAPRLGGPPRRQGSCGGPLDNAADLGSQSVAQPLREAGSEDYHQNTMYPLSYYGRLT